LAPQEEPTLADAHASIIFNDLKIDLPSSSTAGAGGRRTGDTNPHGKKRISLAEYRRRKAAA
jgi:hypothetical protein